jgi:hypothetical protein
VAGDAQGGAAADQHEQPAQHVDRPQPDAHLPDGVVRQQADGVRTRERQVPASAVGRRSAVARDDAHRHRRSARGAERRREPAGPSSSCRRWRRTSSAGSTSAAAIRTRTG